MSPELRLRIHLSPIALATVLAMAAVPAAPVPWLVVPAEANHCTPPCDACVACVVCDACVACDAGCGCNYTPPEACD